MFFAFLPIDGEFFVLQFPFNQTKLRLSPWPLSPFTTGWSKDHQNMFMFRLVLLIPSIRPPVKLFQVPGEMMVLPPKTYCLWQCWDMATIHPTMQKEWGMSLKNILTVKVKLVGNGINACNIFFRDIQKVKLFEICFKKFEFTPGNPWQALLQVKTDKVCLTYSTEWNLYRNSNWNIWKICWLIWSNLRRLDNMLMPWTRKYFCKPQETVDFFYLILTGQLCSGRNEISQPWTSYRCCLFLIFSLAIGFFLATQHSNVNTVF